MSTLNRCQVLTGGVPALRTEHAAQTLSICC